MPTTILKFYRRRGRRLADGRQERRSRAPEGLCVDCWEQRRPDAPGQLYVSGYPCTVPPENQRPVCYCAACVAEAAAIGWISIPWPLPLRLERGEPTSQI